MPLQIREAFYFTVLVVEVVVSATLYGHDEDAYDACNGGDDAAVLVVEAACAAPWQ